MDNMVCVVCGGKLVGRQRLYCNVCSVVKDKERKRNWVIKRNPNAYQPREEKFCCVCGSRFSSSFNGKPYCNKHYLRMLNNGTTEKKQRKSKNEYTVIGDTAFLKTTKGVTFLIDAQDLEKVLKYTWCQNKSGGYLVANINNKVNRLTRYLLEPQDNLYIDHINGDVLDNTRKNLRICTPLNNARNTTVSKRSTTGKLGISTTPIGKYRARIMVNRKEIFLGIFDAIEDAVKARERAETKYFKEFAPFLRNKT